MSKYIALLSALAAGLGLAQVSNAAIYTVNNTNVSGSGSLAQALTQAQTDTNATINLNPGLGPIVLNSTLPQIQNNLVINGNSNTINGSNTFRIFFVNATNKSIQINGLTLLDGVAQGGNGGAGQGGGGGGAGLGGAIFLNAGNLTISNVAFSNNAARGGAGGGVNGGQGGSLGLTGDAGNGASPTLPDGGGGGGGLATGNNSIGGNGGNGSDFSGGGGAGSSDYLNAGTAGNGGFGGGGGGGAYGYAGAFAGGAGGFGGGGGGGGTGGSVGGSAGAGGFGGGNGATGVTGNGGGGLGAGGAIFARLGSALTLQDCTFNGDTVVAGPAGASPAAGGSAIGQALFLGASANFCVSSGTNLLGETIGGGNNANAQGSFTKSGPGTLILTNTESYYGGTILSNGTLEVVNNLLPHGTVNILSNAVLDYNYSTRIVATNGITYTGTGTLRVNGNGGDVVFGPSATYVNFLPGAWVDVEAGELTGSSSWEGFWANNYASLNIASNALFDAVEASFASAMQVDALTGAGTFSGGYFGNANGGLTTLTIGVAGGSGTFSGKLLNDANARLGIVKVGAGTETLTGTNNTYSGNTTVGGGTLVINGNAGAGAVTVTNGTLAGIGTIVGAVTVGTNGTIAPGNPTGALIISNSLSLAGKTFITLNSGACSKIAGLTNITYGGTLIITNLGGPLTLGDAFNLFTSAASSGNFINITGNAGSGLAFSFNPANGVLSVVPLLPTTPGKLYYAVHSGSFTVNWPANYTGWILQAQTNNCQHGIGSNWVDVAGSAVVSSMTFPVAATNNVFFRLRLPTP